MIFVVSVLCVGIVAFKLPNTFRFLFLAIFGTSFGAVLWAASCLVFGTKLIGVGSFLMFVIFGFVLANLYWQRL